MFHLDLIQYKNLYFHIKQLSKNLKNSYLKNTQSELESISNCISTFPSDGNRMAQRCLRGFVVLILECQFTVDANSGIRTMKKWKKLKITQIDIFLREHQFFY